MKQIKLNIRGNVVSVKRYVRNLCKRCTTSISPSLKTTRGTRYVDFFFFSRLDFRFGPFGFSGFRLDFRSDSGFGFEKCEGYGIDDTSIAGR